MESQCGKSCDDNHICGDGGYGGYYLLVYGTGLQVSPHLHHLHLVLMDKLGHLLADQISSMYNSCWI